jgi:hypothetical protein
MRIFVFETNLMWSSRLARTLAAFGHEPLLRTTLPETDEGADLAIVNLGSPEPSPSDLVARLHFLGVKVLAHAGHKEKELHELGRQIKADRLATNSELTFKLPQLIEEIFHELDDGAKVPGNLKS